jgi:hypothetical protein
MNFTGISFRRNEFAKTAPYGSENVFLKHTVYWSCLLHVRFLIFSAILKQKWQEAVDLILQPKEGGSEAWYHRLKIVDRPSIL